MSALKRIEEKPEYKPQAVTRPIYVHDPRCANECCDRSTGKIVILSSEEYGALCHARRDVVKLARALDKAALDLVLASGVTRTETQRADVQELAEQAERVLREVAGEKP